LYSIVDHNNRLDYTEILNKVEIACKKATNPLENLLQYEQVLELVTPLNKYKSILRNYDSSVVNDPTRVDTLDQTHTNGYISDVATRATDIAESIINEYPQSGT
jgi:predicted RNA-binding protein with PIN domain